MATFSETDEALMLAYVYGELEASDARAFAKRLDAEPDLRAEVDGMKAAHSLFGRDAAWGLASGVDVPPPHLVDAIVRAEALARVPAVREAMLKRGASSSTFTAKLARWLIGGGVLVAGAATVMIVVTRPAHAPATFESVQAPSGAPAAPAAAALREDSRKAVGAADRTAALDGAGSASSDAAANAAGGDELGARFHNRDVAGRFADEKPKEPADLRLGDKNATKRPEAKEQALTLGRASGRVRV